MTDRVIRKSVRHASLDATNLLSTVLLAECIQPSKVLWLVSPWISDVAVFDNRGATFSYLLPDVGEREIRFSEVLEYLATRGSIIVVATRDDSLNARFREAILPSVRAGLIKEVIQNDLHEKTFAGDDFVMTGSMNMTYSGLNVNEEQLTFSRDPARVAQAHAELRPRWGPEPA